LVDVLICGTSGWSICWACNSTLANATNFSATQLRRNTTSRRCRRCLPSAAGKLSNCRLLMYLPCQQPDMPCAGSVTTCLDCKRTLVSEEHFSLTQLRRKRKSNRRCLSCADELLAVQHQQSENRQVKVTTCVQLSLAHIVVTDHIHGRSSMLDWALPRATVPPGHRPHRHLHQSHALWSSQMNNHLVAQLNSPISSPIH
jgi:hypothetical protein